MGPAADALDELRARVVAATAAGTPLRLRGAGSKDFHGETLVGEVLDCSPCAGIVDYEPSELVITARCGTRLSQIEATLARSGQCLPFEPPRFGGGDPTIGGVVAAGLSGPRRPFAGAVRDYVLGAQLLDANGALLRFGGKVMKNVAGFDVARLLCGSLGFLGLITEVSLKVGPLPRGERTLELRLGAAAAVDLFNRLRAQPLPLSATSWFDGIARIRLGGPDGALDAAEAKIEGTRVADDAGRAWWDGLRDQTHSYFAAASTRLWRLSLPPTAPLQPIGCDLVEWSGALRWLRGNGSTAQIRQQAAALGGSAMIWNGPRDAPMFHPLDRASVEMHRRLKAQFDPGGLFNRGRLLADL